MIASLAWCFSSFCQCVAVRAGCRIGGQSGLYGSLLALERLSEARAGPVPRFTSKGELATLEVLVGKYGDDVAAMARDVKLNADQRTAGELRRAIRKAGGTGALCGGG